MKPLKTLTLLSLVGSVGLTAACSTIPSSHQTMTAPPAALIFDPARYQARTITVNNSAVAVRAYENIPYVTKPVDPATQVMNIYVPEAYFRGERIGAYTARTAPIFLPNQVGGYMPARPGTLDGTGMPGPADRPNTIALALARGYVVATPGARGRTSRDANERALDQGQDLSSHAWLRIEGGSVQGIDFDRYLRYLGRMKVPPAFDGLDLGAGENQLFGSERSDKRHFTDFSASHSTAPAAERAEIHTVAMMNPMNYIGVPGATNARYWRIRHGTNDKDTSLAIPALLALALDNRGVAVDFELPWDRPHSGDYDLDELFAWMDRISSPSGALRN
jgi:hypothetical protein